MDQVSSSSVPPKRRPTVMRRVLWGTLILKLVLALGLGLGAGLLYLRLVTGPLRFESLSERVTTGIASRMGPGWRVTLRDSAIELDADGSLALRAAGLDVRNPEGALVVRAPLAIVSLDTWSLATLSVQPRAIDFRDLQLRGRIRRDGGIDFASSEPDAAPLPVNRVDEGVSPVSAAVASLFGIVLDTRSVTGAIDRARITNARLTLVDEDMRERAVFHRVDGIFRRGSASNGRSFELRLDGPHGAWRIGGDVEDVGVAGHRKGVLTLDDLPSADLLLLSGFSRLPVTTDLKLSVRASIALAAGRIETMKLAMKTSDGTILIEQKDFNPVAIEGIAATASWDEGRRALALDTVEYLGGGNEIRLKGEWVAGGEAETWSLALRAADARLRGAGPRDGPVRIDALEARFSGREGGVALDRLAVRGPDLNGTITGSAGTAADRRGLTLRILADGTDARKALRLWPENITPPIRTYLVEAIRRARVESLDLYVQMSDAEMAVAADGGKVPEEGVKIAFRVSDGEMVFAEGAPPIVGARVEGKVTGTTTKVRGATAELKLPNGRSLAIADGSFTVADPVPNQAMARIGLRLGGGADGIAALLQMPLLRGIAQADIEPALVKGQADLRLDFDLPLDHPQPVAELPVAVTGTLSDLSLDRVMGKDRLEGGRLALTYDTNGFTMRGDARLAGAPVTIDLRQPRGNTPGEAVVNVVLDEAARGRKGMPVGPQVTGPVSARIVVPLGRAAGKATRVEADLAKAAIDGLLPGWTKAAGRPGKLAFTMGEPGEFRDIVLDSGITSLRGSATFSTEGTLERADLTSLKLSTGDDLKAQIERSGSTYRVTVKGNVADARPFLKSMGNSAAGGGGKDTGPSRDVDAEIAVNILTGFNDEVLTNATAKVSHRGRDVRQFQMQGRFRSARFSAQMTRSERGAPSLNVQSDDAGATLRYLDVYRRMHGGRLALQADLNDGPQAGQVQVRAFTLRNEPALKSIMSQQGDAGLPQDRAAAAPIQNLEGSGIAFERAGGRFVRSAGRIDFTDASISGPEMGFTLNGWLDYARDRTDISGTFVPLYGLNNAFAQLPLLGPILTGGRNEGIFAINFRVAGSVASPTISVNPLSAVAPGFLRKLFGVGGGDEPAPGTSSQRPMSDR